MLKSTGKLHVGVYTGQDTLSYTISNGVTITSLINIPFYRLNGTMFVLLVTSMYPHYYGWWVLINYLNDENDFLWAHQVTLCTCSKPIHCMYYMHCLVHFISYLLLLMVLRNSVSLLHSLLIKTIVLFCFVMFMAFTISWFI